MPSLFKWLLVFAWMGVIFTFSNEPAIMASSVDQLDFLIKKSAHIFEYTILFLLLFNALKKNRLQNAFLLGLVYAFSDELHQLLVPGRTGMLRDVLTFDTIGLLFGGIIAGRFSSWKQK
jgi:VanZ family protein